MYILAMLAAMFVSVVVFGVFVVTIAGRNKEEMLRKDKERYEEWQNIVANTEFPTQSQLHLQAVKEDNERTELSMGEMSSMIFGGLDRSSKKNLAVVEESPVELSLVEEKAAATA